VSYALEARGLSKTFLNRKVLKSVDLSVRQGEIVGLVGQNGSGKSTFIKIISGVYEPDTGGALRVLGRDVELPMSRSSRSLGLAFVHQDLGLFNDGSVLENVRVGRYETGLLWRIDWRKESAYCSQALARVGLKIDPDSKVADLSHVDRALVAIARAVDEARQAHGAGVIVLDEPTSYLPRDGVDRLFAAVRELRAGGIGVIFVSHRLNEVADLCDAIVVLRDGAVVARLDASETDESEIVDAMLGRKMQSYYPEAPQRIHSEVGFRVEHVSGHGVEDVSFSVHKGEIYGVTGLLGMGQERLLYLLNGANPGSGRVECSGKSVDLRTMDPRRGGDMGIALLPADRVRASGVQEATVMENITLPMLAKYTRLGRIRHGQEISATKSLIERYDVRPPDAQRQLRTLSGGNQQKALLAKWMNASPKVMLLHEPTQGVDVGAKQQIFAQLRDAADAGVSIVVATTEYEDLAAICDRVMVMRDGRKVIELGGESLSHDRLVEECYKSDRSAA
jgi:ribose transport system ATP-binding protein